MKERKVTHQISLTVGVTNAEDWTIVWEGLNEAAKEFKAANVASVSVSSYDVETQNEEVVEYSDETLYHDDQTLDKVREVLLQHGGGTHSSIEEIVSAMLNSGILFRERHPSSDD